jgi:natural product precursor
MRKLKLRRETIVNLTDSDLKHVQGGDFTIVVIIRTRACPVLTNGCTGGGCVETIGTGTSVINPSGG